MKRTDNSFVQLLKAIFCVVGSVCLGMGLCLLPFGDGIPARTTSFFYKTVELSLDAKTGLIMSAIGVLLLLLGVFFSRND